MKGVSIVLACRTRLLGLAARRPSSFPYSRPTVRLFSDSADPLSGRNLVVRSTDQVAVDDDTLEKEKILFRMKREMANHYAKHDYEKALLAAVEMQDKAEELYGSANPVFASCLSNTALMQKLTQFYDVSMDNYTKALHIYEDLPTHGKRSSQYLTTLTNLGSLYRELAMQKKGVEKHELLQRAVEALAEVCETRLSIQGSHHRDTITAQLHLATLYRVQNQESKALELLNLLLPRAITIVGERDLLVATVWNNLGLVHKQRGEFEKAMDCYQRAHFIRSASLGDEHVESIVCLHNQAECLRAQGKELDAEEIQHRILYIMEKHRPQELEEVEMEMDAANSAALYGLPDGTQGNSHANTRGRAMEGGNTPIGRRKRE